MQDSPKKDQQPNAADVVADGAGSAAQQTDSKATENAKPEAGMPESTQEHMGNGAGIRGGYGNSDQTNGLEGNAGTPEAK